IHSFLEAAKMHGFDMVLYANDKNYFTSFDTPDVQTFLDTFQLTTNAPWHPDVKANILGVTLIGVDDDSLKHLSVPTGIHLSPVHVGDVQDAYDIIRQNVNKGQAVQIVLVTMNIFQTVAIAFGDGMNDKEMLHVVGDGFAMCNAHPDLLSYAKHRTNTVTDAGIYNGLKQLGVIDWRPNNLNRERWASLSRRSGLFIEILQSMQCKVRADFADSFISHVQNRRIVIIEQFIPYAF